MPLSLLLNQYMLHLNFSNTLYILYFGAFFEVRIIYMYVHVKNLKEISDIQVSLIKFEL